MNQDLLNALTRIEEYHIRKAGVRHDNPDEAAWHLDAVRAISTTISMLTKLGTYATNRGGD